MAWMEALTPCSKCMQYALVQAALGSSCHEFVVYLEIMHKDNFIE